MVSKLDICRSANILIRGHGEDPPLETAMPADRMLITGDVQGCAVWKRIFKAVDELPSEERLARWWTDVRP